MAQQFPMNLLSPNFLACSPCSWKSNNGWNEKVLLDIKNGGCNSAIQHISCALSNTSFDFFLHSVSYLAIQHITISCAYPQELSCSQWSISSLSSSFSSLSWLSSPSLSSTHHCCCQHHHHSVAWSTSSSPLAMLYDELAAGDLLWYSTNFTNSSVW